QGNPAIPVILQGRPIAPDNLAIVTIGDDGNVLADTAYLHVAPGPIDRMAAPRGFEECRLVIPADTRDGDQVVRREPAEGFHVPLPPEFVQFQQPLLEVFVPAS